MRIPFLHRRERTVAEIAAKATRVGTAEVYTGGFTPSKRTSAEHREAISAPSTCARTARRPADEEVERLGVRQRVAAGRLLGRSALRFPESLST